MKKLCLLFICISLAHTLWGYNLRRISKYDGLSNSSIQTICQDNDGVMWFGTVDGLNIYNGITLRALDMLGQESFSGNLIESMVEAEPGILWIQTNYGLDRYDKYRRSVTRYDMYSSTFRLYSGGDVQLLFVRENEGKSQFVYYNEKSASFAHLPLEGVDYGSLLDYFVSGDNILHLLCRDGQNFAFSMIRDNNGNCMLMPSAAAIEHPLALRNAFHEGTVAYFVDTAGVLYEYDADTKTKHYVADISSNLTGRGSMSAIVKSGNDYFVGLKTGGLICLKYTPDKKHRYRAEQIDIKVGVFSLFKDPRQDIVWIGTDGQGVYIFSNDSYSIKSTFLEDITHHVNKPVRSILLDREQSLWIATKGDGLVRLRDWDFNRDVTAGDKEYFTTQNSLLSAQSVFTIDEGEGNMLWIGSQGGIDWFDYTSETIRRLDARVDGQPLSSVYRIAQQSTDTLWVATVGAGIVRVDLAWEGREPRVVSTRRFMMGDGSASANYFFTAFSKDRETVWFGNRGYGALRLDIPSGEFETVRFDNGEANRTLNDIFCIMKGVGGEMWFGTGAGLVKRMPNGKFTVYDKRSGFSNSTIHGMLQGNEGSIWISTNLGIIRFNPETETFVTFSRNAISDVVEFSDGAFYRSERDGTLFFGGINGFVAIRENKEVGQTGYVPPIVVDRLTIFGEEYNIHDYLLDGDGADPLLKLNHRENFFSLSLTAIDYVSGHNYSYIYRLEGINDTWIDNRSGNTIYFTDIAPGHYTLRVKCLNRETGVESGEYAVRIRITPPWYMSTVAYIVYGLLALGVLLLITGIIVKRNELRRKRIIDEMTREYQKEVFESKLRFFTNIAHEFCTPLTLIQGPCDSIITHKGSDKFVLRYADLIQRNASRINDLIQDLIEFRRIETGHKTPRIESLDMSALVMSIFENFTDLAESRGYTFTCNVAPRIVWNSDRDFIITILGNLISNAFKYTNPKGSIGVGLSVDGDELRIEVYNTGKGIRAENIGRLFDRYSILDDFEHQDEKQTTRNGLGLAISHDMIQLLGGTISVDSERDVRTCFTVRLPHSEPVPDDTGQNVAVDNILPDAVSLSKEHPVEMEIPGYEFDGNKPTVLIIEDDRDMLWFTCEIFAQEYNVIPVNHPFEVEKLLEKSTPDVIISDVMMPELDGITITRHLKANPRTSHVPLILVSAKHRVDEQIEGLKAGADLYVGKPFDVNYLKTFVRHLISRKETLKEYFASPLSAFELIGGRMTHVDHRRFVQQILDIINDNLSDKELSVRFIAAKLNMSTRCLYRRLQEIGAESPLQMIHNCRLHVTRELLQNTSMTIDEIIYKSGFSNRGPFFRAFSEKFGCTPREYRERHMQGKL